MKMDNKIKKVIKTYEFVPEYYRWVTMSKQREIVNKLENITNEKKIEDNFK